jgi:hypothetical protein
MVSDGSYVLFKSMYEAAAKNKTFEYIWDNNKIETTYAKTVCDYVDKHCMPAYDKHIQEDLHSRDEHGL